ncbi:hypothetical protein [Mesorhizobium sp. ESP-6-2]|uniref:hypothetical protein n=1 Tax=Mesorhizobium sp. ESP-6-2 TaxID=2876625 RepID=UPI001CCA13DA|nr:hypothetical protein [Mesorhizobium sp. ESP-6-2]MBZ9807689.1 hypothetical protein [Mesorhizobium sp. ESP-6-2]
MSETPQIGRVAEFIIMSGWILLVVVCFCTILEVCYLAMSGAAISDPLQKLAFTSAGFLFGSFPTMVKDLINAR